MIDFLCGPLGGMKFGTNLPSMYEFSMNKVRSLGQFYICMMPDINIDIEDYYKNTDAFINMIKSDKNMFYPGEKENVFEEESNIKEFLLMRLRKSLANFLELSAEKF